MKQTFLFNNKENNFNAILNEVDATKPMIVIFPGGGYDHLSSRESLPVATRFNQLGYNTTIVNYSVAPHADFIQLKQANQVIEKLSENYENIVVMGFSAGGHLAGICATQHIFKNIKCFVLCLFLCETMLFQQVCAQTIWADDSLNDVIIKNSKDVIHDGTL